MFKSNTVNMYMNNNSNTSAKDESNSIVDNKEFELFHKDILN